LVFAAFSSTCFVAGTTPSALGRCFGVTVACLRRRVVATFRQQVGLSLRLWLLWRSNISVRWPAIRYLAFCHPPICYPISV
jgi:hypothetical protein